jgi:hypothetical protein
VEGGTEQGKGRTVRLLGGAGIVISVLVGAIGLLFTLEPNLKPCLSGPDAAFTGAPVFPHVRFRDHLIRNGTRKEEAAKELNLLGAEVRFSYRTNGLRDHELSIAWSLVRIGPDGAIGGVVAGQDRAEAEVIVPDACSTVRGKDLFVPMPESPHGRYRVVLEIYSGRDVRGDRLALTETATFRD